VKDFLCIAVVLDTRRIAWCCLKVESLDFEDFECGISGSTSACMILGICLQTCARCGSVFCMFLQLIGESVSSITRFRAIRYTAIRRLGRIVHAPRYMVVSLCQSESCRLFGQMCLQLGDKDATFLSDIRWSGLWLLTCSLQIFLIVCWSYWCKSG
jgi:hypothetical protein